jgi:PAS domain S-box-containing protein
MARPFDSAPFTAPVAGVVDLPGRDRPGHRRPRWGWGAWLLAVLLAFLAPRPFGAAIEHGVSVLFLASGALTVLVGTALREALIRLDEARAREQATQAALNETAAHLMLAQEAGGVGLWAWDVVTGKGEWSPVVYRNLGLDPARSPDIKAMLGAVHPDDREMVRQANIAAAKDGVMRPTEYRVIWPDGSIRWLLSRGETVKGPDGRSIRAAGVNIDVTERRMAFEQMRESEARFRALADSAPVLMWVTRGDGKRAFANQSYIDFLGVPYEAALNHDWRANLHPDDLDRIMKEQVAGEASRKLFALEARYRRHDGEFRWVRSLSQPRYAPSGEFEGFVGIGVDVTDAKRAEADLKGINELLAERVQAALAERDTAEAALHRAQKLEAVGQLTGGVAHDFNNLLTVIIGALDLIQRHPDDARRRERMVEAALGAAKRGEQLTHQLLAFARRQNLKPEPVRIDALLADCEPLLRRAVGEAVGFTVSPGCPDGVARTDPSQFEAAVMNLVVNARDAVAAGGTIRLETFACALAENEVEETPAGDYLCLAVHDTGVGMDAETMARVFEPFFTTKAVGKGTGLGLSQIYGFARQTGGGVSLDSAPGQGTTVKIFLPVSPEAPPEPAAPKAAPASEGPSLDILLVEDDPAVGDMVAAMLSDFGHRVTRAEDADAALAVLSRQASVDLMLTDVVMPGALTGVDLAHRVVAARPGLPIILSSGYTGEILSSAIDAPWPLLRKPYSSEDLARAIEAATSRAPQVA